MLYNLLGSSLFSLGGSQDHKKRQLWSDRGQRVGTLRATAQTHLVPRRPGRRGPWCRGGRPAQPQRPSWCWAGWRASLSVRRAEMGVCTRCWLRPSTVQGHLPALYRPLGRWGNGTWGWGGKFLSTAVLSDCIAQLRPQWPQALRISKNSFSEL